MISGIVMDLASCGKRLSENQFQTALLNRVSYPVISDVCR
ncbi:hypothetical protein HMPREF9370_2266 [Neisseria wadsworthii 9715]|uniref:Uncharacterized protein n=1 Tax=Neisseria wadsworthii 9715 TaxID=1030841 RepID=G4CT56_9NEIS|nr:hypothetical protein HMPREF9370_2266 [Neisseria wadsworthii 9715]